MHRKSVHSRKSIFEESIFLRNDSVLLLFTNESHIIGETTCWISSINATAYIFVDYCNLINSRKLLCNLLICWKNIGLTSNHNKTSKVYISCFKKVSKSTENALPFLEKLETAPGFEISRQFTKEGSTRGRAKVI